MAHSLSLLFLLFLFLSHITLVSSNEEHSPTQQTIDSPSNHPLPSEEVQDEYTHSENIHKEKTEINTLFLEGVEKNPPAEEIPPPHEALHDKEMRQYDEEIYIAVDDIVYNEEQRDALEVEERTVEELHIGAHTGGEPLLHVQNSAGDVTQRAFDHQTEFQMNFEELIHTDNNHHMENELSPENILLDVHTDNSPHKEDEIQTEEERKESKKTEGDKSSLQREVTNEEKLELAEHTHTSEENKMNAREKSVEEIQEQILVEFFNEMNEAVEREDVDGIYQIMDKYISTHSHDSLLLATFQQLSNQLAKVYSQLVEDDNEDLESNNDDDDDDDDGDDGDDQILSLDIDEFIIEVEDDPLEKEVVETEYEIKERKKKEKWKKWAIERKMIDWRSPKYSVDISMHSPPPSSSQLISHYVHQTINNDGFLYSCSIPVFSYSTPFISQTSQQGDIHKSNDNDKGGDNELEDNKPVEYGEFQLKERDEEIAVLFGALYSMCFYQNLNTDGWDYFYKFCPGRSMHRAALISRQNKKRAAYEPLQSSLPFVESESGEDAKEDFNEISSMGFTFRKIEVVSKFNKEYTGKFGIVINDIAALYQYGYSTYFYQWHSERLLVKYHCKEAPGMLGINERRLGVFELNFAAPAVCRHPLIHLIDNQSDSISCTLLDDPLASRSIDGDWLIFDVGALEYLYTGTVSFNSLATLPPFLPSFLPFPFDLADSDDIGSGKEEVKLIRTYWSLDAVNYVGMGLYHGGHGCVSWSTNLTPGVSMFYIQNNQTLIEHFWSPSFRGHSLSLSSPSSSSSPSLLKDEFINYSSVTQASGEQKIVTSLLTFNTTWTSNKYTVHWQSHDEAFRKDGVGILSDNYLCVLWRTGTEEKLDKNDGIIHYTFNNNKVLGTWTLYQMMGLRREDLVRKPLP